MSQPLFSLYCLMKTMKLFNKWVICHVHYLKSILNDPFLTFSKFMHLLGELMNSAIEFIQKSKV